MIVWTSTRNIVLPYLISTYIKINVGENFWLGTEITIYYWDILTHEYTNDSMSITNWRIHNCSYHGTNILSSQMYESMFINWRLFIIINYGQGIMSIHLLQIIHSYCNCMIISMLTISKCNTPLICNTFNVHILDTLLNLLGIKSLTKDG